MAWTFNQKEAVYLQIADRLRRDVLSGRYPPDGQIPTVRQLAFEAAVNPNTVQKAFSADGPIYCKTMQDWRLHLGVDFAGEEGQNVKAVTRGTVITVNNDPLWGGVVEIDHGIGVITRYCGVKATVKVGDKVDMGQVIGNLQTIPCECAQSAHLHLEMIVDGMPIDPVAAIALDVRYAETTD